MKTRILILITLFCAAIGKVQSVHAAIIQVTNGNDSGPGSLRHALATAVDGDTILLFPNFTPGMEVVLTSGELLVNKDVTITPVNGRLQRVPVRRSHGAPAFRIFHIAPGKMVDISGLIITNGIGAGAAFGGGIWNDQATLEIRHCTISGNSDSGIFNDVNNIVEPRDATLTINHCTISGNSGFFGGAIRCGSLRSGSKATVSINFSTITGNSAVKKGGGIYIAGQGPRRLTIQGCTISANSATGTGVEEGDGGGIYLFGPGPFDVLVRNSTLSSNSATHSGGAIGRNATGTVEVVNCTVTDNAAPLTGGIQGGRIGNTILKTGSMGSNVSSGVTSLGYNLSNDNGSGRLTAPGDQINTHPMLGRLQDNGGPTLTQEPLPGSPAINAGDPHFTPPPEFDQRGADHLRVVNGRLDIGAVEVQR